MDERIQTIAAIITSLRGLFKDKDRLIGVDDWDTFIGCLMLLEEVGNSFTESNTNAVVEKPEETTAEGE